VLKASRFIDLLCALAVCALAGCAKEGEQRENRQQLVRNVEETPSNNLVAVAPRPPGNDEQLRPGLWERTFRFVHIDMANVSAEARPHIADRITIRVCLTPEQAAHPFDALLARDRAQGCSVSRITMAGGQMSGTKICPTIIATIRGTYSATAYDVTMHARVFRGGRTTNMETHSVARRVGECNDAERDPRMQSSQVQRPDT
jgi:hypothetical protein